MGWTVVHCFESKTYSRDFALLGEARLAGLRDACWSSTKQVSVAPFDCTGIVVCGFQQPDGLWRDQCSDIRAFEAWQDRADLSAHLISGITTLDDPARRLILYGVEVGGVVAHSTRHRGCLLAQSEGLIARSEKWTLTRHGRRWLEDRRPVSGASPA